MRTNGMVLTAFIAAALLSGRLQAQPPSNTVTREIAVHVVDEAKPMEGCQAMMAKKQAMTAEMNAMDTQLDSLVAAMNAAKGNKRVDAVAAVVNELVTQRKAMRNEMATMEPMMMGHMMEHMRMGMMEGMTKSMASCPMMGQDPSSQTPHQH